MKKPIGKKNIFVIPSWFPTIFQPLQGTFTKEQIEALEVYAGGEYRFIVSYWGFNDTEVSFYSPSDALKKIIHFTSKKNHHFTENGVHYIETPYLNISNKIPYFGSFDRLIGAHLKSIRMAESLFGSIDLIHAHVSYPAGYLSSKLSSILQIPYVITEHMAPFPFDRYKKGDRAIPEINEAILNASAVIAVSDAHAAQIESYDYPRPFVIPNLVNEDLFQPLDIQISKKPFRYFSLGHLEKRKGIHDLLVAVALWNPAQKDVKFGIGGTGEEFQALKLQAKELNVEHLIEWYGDMSREKVANYMQNCQAFVLPSY
ncbi:MAG: glycosyltransferase, partial [Candidatus Paceibacterota bacterium]